MNFNQKEVNDGYLGRRRESTWDSMCSTWEMGISSKDLGRTIVLYSYLLWRLMSLVYTNSALAV